MTVQYQFYEEGYSVVRLDRPEKRNAINMDMVEQLEFYLEQAKKESIKFLVITSTDDNMFCAGGDLNDLHGDLTSEEAFGLLYQMKEVLFTLVSFPVPTICLLNGDALGGGCEIATACDFRIAKEATAFGFIQTKLGIIPGWGGGTLLYEKVHPSFAYHWIVDAQIYEATFLKEQGWIHKIVPNEVWGKENLLLKSYLSKSLEQMKFLKSQYKRKLSVLGLSAQMNEDVRNCANLWNSKEHLEIVQQFLEQD